MEIGVVRAPALRFPARVRAFVEGEALLVGSVASFATACVLRLVGQVNQDAWLAFVGGREIAAYGLPHTDHLTLWTHGAAWVDQQWLGQLALYGAVHTTGLAGTALLHALLTCGAYVLAIVAARRLGATSRGVLYTFPVCLWLLVFGSWQLRTQSFSYLPFVAVVWVLARDSRERSLRTLWILPLLALWGSVHGAVVLAVVLACLRGAFLVPVAARRATRSRAVVTQAAALVVLSPLMLLVSPYGLALVGYYRSTLFNQGFGALVNEWQPLTLTPDTLPFFALAVAAVALVARRPGVLTRFEVGVLAVTAVATLSSQRNQVWFALAALVFLPRFAAPQRERALTAGQRRLNAALALVATGVLAASIAWAAALPANAFEASYPRSAAATVATAAAQDPQLRIYADVHYADWLLWQEPQLAGRIAFDARFELLTLRQLASVYDFTEPTDGQRSTVLRRYGLLVLDPDADRSVIRSLAHDRAARVLYRGPGAVVISRH